MEGTKLKEDRFFWLWVLFFSVLILLSPLIEGGESYHTVIALRLWVIGFALYYSRFFIRKERIELVLPYGNWLIIGLWVLVSCSLFLTHYYYITIYWYSNFLVYLILFYFILNLLSKESLGKRLLISLIFILLLAGVMEGVLGITDYLLHRPGRARGSFFNPAYYSGYLLALVSFPLSALVFDFLPGVGARRKMLLKFGLGLTLIIIFGGLLVSASRAMIFSLVPIGLILLVRFRLKALLALILLCLGLALIPNPFRTRLKNLESDPYAWDRITIWKTSLRMIKRNPFGVGLGMYQYYYDRDAYPSRSVKIGRYSKSAQWAHNELLNFAVECSALGPVLILFWLFLLVPALVSVLGKTQEQMLKENLAVLLGFLGSFLGILAHSLVDSNLHQPPIMLLCIIDLGGVLYLLSDFKPGLLKKVYYPIFHSGFLKTFLFLTGALMALMMTYQAGIFGLFFRARKFSQPEQRINYMIRLGKLPSGYAPLYFQIAFQLKNLSFKTENPELGLKAIPYFEFAGHLNPEDYAIFYHWADALYKLAFSLQTPQLFSRAEQIAKLSLERSSHYPFTYILLANIAHLDKDFKKEEKWLKRALENEPYYFFARLLLIDLLINLNRESEAQAELELLKAQKREVEGMDKTGWSNYQLILIQITEPEIRVREEKLKEMAQKGLETGN